MSFKEIICYSALIVLLMTSCSIQNNQERITPSPVIDSQENPSSHNQTSDSGAVVPNNPFEPEYTKNNSDVFIDSTIIPGADTGSFQKIGSPFSRDKSHVYFYDKIINDADPSNINSCEKISLGMRCITDKSNLYYQGYDDNLPRLIQIRNFDRNSYSQEGKLFGKDKNQVYFHMIECGDGCYITDFHVIGEADPRTFRVIQEDWKNGSLSADNKTVYITVIKDDSFQTRKIEGIDPKSFMALSPLDQKKLIDQSNTGTIVSTAWKEINNENFWSKIEGYNNLGISFSYPEDWTFNCCGDRDDGSVHQIEAPSTSTSSGNSISGGKPQILIMKHIIRCKMEDIGRFENNDCKSPLTIDEDFDNLTMLSGGIIHSSIGYGFVEVSRDWIMTRKLFDPKKARGFVFRRNNDIYIIQFYNYHGLPKNFINEFLSKIKDDQKNQ